MLRILFSFACCVMCSATLTAIAQKAADSREVSPTAEKDILPGAIDPFMLGPQRNALLRASGVDLELAEEEFDADRAQGEGFARSFDTWEAILPFDTNQNSTIDWLEAAEYRRALREVMLARHDKDRSKRLEKEERAALLKELEGADIVQWLRDHARQAGELGMNPTEAGQAQGGDASDLMGLSDPGGESLEEYQERAKKLLATEKEPWLSDDDEKRRMAIHALSLTEDLDGDGRFTRADSELMELRMRQIRKKNSEREVQEAIKRYDANGNGRLDPDESAAIKKETERRVMIQFDKNRDGVLDERERQHRAYLPVTRHYQSLEECDEDGDGVLNEREYESRYRRGQINMYLRTATPEEVNRLYGAYRSEHWSEFDQDSDKQLNENEVAVLNEAFTKESQGKAPITNYPYKPGEDTSLVPNE